MSYIIEIKQGNLLDEEDATFTVNASNTQLLLGSGVSMAFKRHCGLELQNEMNSKLKSLNFSLKKGDVVATSSANATNFKYTLHAVIMDYNRGVRGEAKLPTIEDIDKALINIESYIKWYYQKSKLKDIKVVIPLLGCGVGGLSKIDVINLYKEFFLRDIEFNCVITIYGYNSKDFEMIKKVIYA